MKLYVLSLIYTHNSFLCIWMRIVCISDKIPIRTAWTSSFSKFNTCVCELLNRSLVCFLTHNLVCCICIIFLAIQTNLKKSLYKPCCFFFFLSWDLRLCFYCSVGKWKPEFLCATNRCPVRRFLFAMKCTVHCIFATDLHNRHETKLDAVQITMSLFVGLLSGL